MNPDATPPPSEPGGGPDNLDDHRDARKGTPEASGPAGISPLLDCPPLVHLARLVLAGSRDGICPRDWLRDRYAAEHRGPNQQNPGQGERHVGVSHRHPSHQKPGTWNWRAVEARARRPGQGISRGRKSSDRLGRDLSRLEKARLIERQADVVVITDRRGLTQLSFGGR